jgi:hypothetical protein
VIDSSIFRPSLDGNDGIFGTSFTAKEKRRIRKGGKYADFAVGAVNAVGIAKYSYLSVTYTRR